MLKYDILAISMSNLEELGPIFHPLGHMFPVRLIMSGVLQTKYYHSPSGRMSRISFRGEARLWLGLRMGLGTGSGTGFG